MPEQSQELGKIRDILDELRLSMTTHHARMEELLTQIDLALRAILISISQHVQEVSAKADELKQKTADLENAQRELKTTTMMRLDNIDLKVTNAGKAVQPSPPDQR